MTRQDDDATEPGDLDALFSAYDTLANEVELRHITEDDTIATELEQPMYLTALAGALNLVVAERVRRSSGEIEPGDGWDGEWQALDEDDHEAATAARFLTRHESDVLQALVEGAHLGNGVLRVYLKHTMRLARTRGKMLIYLEAEDETLLFGAPNELPVVVDGFVTTREPGDIIAAFVDGGLIFGFEGETLAELRERSERAQDFIKSYARSLRADGLLEGGVGIDD